jgi:hypothetical protein
MLPFIFPSSTVSSKSKLMLIYHQYGFPQNMNKVLDYSDAHNLITIEDCAHALNSKYNDKQLGSFGDFTIFSYSKFVNCYVLGGVSYKDKGFGEFLNLKKNYSSILLPYFNEKVKRFSEYNFSSSVLKNWQQYLLNMSFSVYGQTPKYTKKSLKIYLKNNKREIEIREKRYQYVLDIFQNTGIFDHLESDNICPYVIPIIAKEQDMKKIVDKLQTINIKTGIFQFDVKRVFYEPHFVSALLLQCGSRLNEASFLNQVDIVKRIIIK